MKQWNLGKKRIVGISLVIVQILLVIFCIWGMNGEQEVYSIEELPVLQYGGRMEEDGSYYIDESVVLPDNVFLSMELPELKRGVYEVYVAFDAETEQVSKVSSESAGYRKLYENAVSLRPAEMQNEISYRFMLWERVDDLKVEILYTGIGKFKVTDIQVVHTRQEYSMLLMLILLSLLISIAVFYRFVGDGFRKIEKTEKKILFSLSVIFLLSCSNLLIDYSHLGDDAFFHMNRIEGIAREWMIGNFPARLESYCMLGMGYPTSIMYPDVFLWPAAFLRVMGFDLTFCFKADIAFINLLTALLSYVSFKNIFGSRKVGLLGSAIYTLSLYRLYNIYDRMAVGEFTAMAFLPLICWGLTRVFSEKEEVVRDKKTVLLLAFGYMGVLYSHVLSMEFVLVFTIMLCLLCLKYFLRKSTFFAFVKAALLAVGLSLWYVIPFLDYSLHFKMKVFASGRPIQMLGLYPAQLFWLFPWGGNPSYMYMSGMRHVRAYGMGVALVMIFFCFFYFRIKGVGGKTLQEWEEYPKMRIAAQLGILAMFMSLYIFPWDAISELSEGMRKIVYSIQFPYRFLEMVTICFAFLGCGLFVILLQEGNGKKGICFAAAAFILTLLCSSFYLNHELQGRGWSDFREAASMGPYIMIGGGEYLPEGTDVEKLRYTEALAGEGVILKEYKKENAHIEFWCENEGVEESYMECNLLYYPGYQAIHKETGKRLAVALGTNNVLRIKIPSGFSGSVSVDFMESGYWKIGNVVSAVLWLVLLGIWGASYCKRKKCWRICLAGGNK